MEGRNNLLLIVILGKGFIQCGKEVKFAVVNYYNIYSPDFLNCIEEKYIIE